LSIVRSIVTAHGGTVRAEPRDGGGLVVRVTLPARRSDR
jgi:signal transduction histidine kinase